MHWLSSVFHHTNKQKNKQTKNNRTISHILRMHGRNWQQVWTFSNKPRRKIWSSTAKWLKLILWFPQLFHCVMKHSVCYYSSKKNWKTNAQWQDYKDTVASFNIGKLGMGLIWALIIVMHVKHRRTWFYQVRHVPGSTSVLTLEQHCC